MVSLSDQSLLWEQFLAYRRDHVEKREMNAFDRISTIARAPYDLLASRKILAWVLEGTDLHLQQVLLL